MTREQKDIFMSEEKKEKEKIIQEIARKNFSIWNSALRGGNPKEVSVLYSADATFLPTLSAKFKRRPNDVEEYFKHFLEKKPIGEIVEEEIGILGNDCYLHSGMYNFKVGQDNDRQIVEARFTFVWKKNDLGEWKIIHHHSSPKPKE